MLKIIRLCGLIGIGVVLTQLAAPQRGVLYADNSCEASYSFQLYLYYCNGHPYEEDQNFCIQSGDYDIGDTGVSYGWSDSGSCNAFAQDEAIGSCGRACQAGGVYEVGSGVGFCFGNYGWWYDGTFEGSTHEQYDCNDV